MQAEPHPFPKALKLKYPLSIRPVFLREGGQETSTKRYYILDDKSVMVAEALEYPYAIEIVRLANAAYKLWGEIDEHAQSSESPSHS